MKTILNTLLISAFALCELPPPYPQRAFRPRPQFLGQSSSLQYPKSHYEPSRLISNIIDVNLPSKLTIGQLIRLTEQLQSSQTRVVNKPQTIQLSTPQNSYLPPPRQPQRAYGPPSKHVLSQSQLRPPPASNSGISQPQSTYGAPQVSQQTFKPSTRPQNQYLPPQSLNSASNAQGNPQTSYGVPILPQPSQPSNLGASNNHLNPQIPPATSYGVPDLRGIETFGELRNKPQTDQDILRKNLLNDLSKQHLPYKQPTGFSLQRGQDSEVQNVPQYLPAKGGNNYGGQPAQNVFGNSQQGNFNNNLLQSGGNNPNNIPQSTGGTGNLGFTKGGSPNSPQNVLDVNEHYLPANGGNGVQRPPNIPSNIPQSTGGENIPNILQSSGTGNGGVPNNGGAVNNIGHNYLPPRTTSSPGSTPGTTTLRPRTIGTTPVTSDGTTNYNYDYDLQQPTEAPSNQDDSTSDSNVAISNAVAGGGGFFYLQQPDGRLQKVVLQKTQDPNGKPEEYAANYYFQNIQALPSVTYTPLISLGSWK